MAENVYWALALFWQAANLGVATARIIQTRGRVNLRPYAARFTAPVIVGGILFPILQLIY